MARTKEGASREELEPPEAAHAVSPSRRTGAEGDGELGGGDSHGVRRLPHPPVEGKQIELKLEGAEPHLDGKSKGEKNHGAGIRPQECERHNIERRRGLTGSRQERWHLSDGQRWEAQERDSRVVVILSPEVDEAARVMVVD